MGYSLAKIASELGANVKLLLGPTNLSMDLSNIECIRVQDSDEMYAQTIKHFKRIGYCDFFCCYFRFQAKKN